MFGKKVILLAASVLAISLWGCSTDFDAENSQSTAGSGTTVTEAALVGAGNCIGCHQDASLSTTASPQAVADYLASKHVIHSSFINAASEAGCLECHDPLGDGPSLEQFITDASDIPLDGLAAVTCENCHGGGGDHVSSQLPVPYVTPDYNRCGQCHNANVDHHERHPEADSIVEKVSASPHVNVVTKTEAPCVKCHSDEGAKLYKNVFGAPSTIDANITTNLTSASPIQCRTCHQAHSLNLLLASGENYTGSAEFNTCTNCHQTSEAYHGETGPVGLDLSRVIYDTHFDDPTTFSGSRTLIEGYNLGPIDGNGDFSIASERVCRDCHDVHAADTTKNRQWANSAHGGHIAQVKAAAVAAGDASSALTASVDTSSGAAWVFFDWDESDRQECQRCHSSTGTKNYLNAMISNTDDDPDNDETYNPVNNNFSHLSGWVQAADGTTVTSSGQNEMLYCWGCHANNSGDLRNPTSINLDYGNNAVVLSTDLGKSKLCATCHGGRANMDSFELTGDPSTDMSGVAVGDKSHTETHNLAAAATIYQADTRVGYRYQSLDYTDKRWYAHKGIGLNSDTPESGSGPCATCHMDGTDHSLELAVKTDSDLDGDDDIVELKTTICVTCHDGEHALFVSSGLVGTTQNIWNGTTAVPTTVTQQMADNAAAELEHESEAFHDALLMITDGLIAKGFSITTNFPFFSGTNWIDEGTFGAAVNLSYLENEPGAWAHNSYYAKRLIFDSVDWLDNGVLDGTININAATYPEAAAWLGAATSADPAAIPPVNIGDTTRP